MSKATAQMGLKPGDARAFRFTLLVSRFNSEFTGRLRRNAEARLKALGALPAKIRILEVPGALELPLAAKAAAKKADAVLCLGAVLRGDTSHYDLVCSESARGVVQAGLDTGVPCLFGVITCDTRAQALARCQGGPKDAGRHAADAAVWMAKLLAGMGKK
jgi:6,7-dimethyl-8-ribityllumazine synthase